MVLYWLYRDSEAEAHIRGPYDLLWTFRAVGDYLDPKSMDHNGLLGWFWAAGSVWDLGTQVLALGLGGPGWEPWVASRPTSRASTPQLSQIQVFRPATVEYTPPK